MTTPPIPQVMIEAVAAQLAREWTADSNGISPTDSWASPPVPPSLEENWRERYREAARRVLAAAFEGCEVQEQRRWRIETAGAVVAVSTWMPTFEADEWFTTFVKTLGETGTAERRLLVGTPAEQVDTEGAPA